VKKTREVAAGPVGMAIFAKELHAGDQIWDSYEFNGKDTQKIWCLPLNTKSKPALADTRIGMVLESMLISQ